MSADSFHSESLGLDAIYNIIKVFENKYKLFNNFKLQFHTLQGDNTMEFIANQLDNCELIYNDTELVSDNSKVIKIMPNHASLRFNNGYEIEVGIAKLFFPNLLVDLTAYNSDIQKSIEVFEKDMNESEFDNPSILTNCDSSLGLDMWINFNGNVTTWGNQQLDNLLNVYVDSFQDFIDGTFNNIISYSFLDKGFSYRENIIKKVNPRAVLRSKAINIRDYAGAFLLEEDKTRLFYGIQVIKDYLNEGVLTEEDISILPENLISIIKMDDDDIIKLYNSSDFDIIRQYMNDNSKLKDQLDWDILFTLIKLGHYDVSEDSITEAINYYNKKYSTSIKNLDDIPKRNDIAFFERLHQRLSFMKKEALELCIKLHQ